MKTITTGSKSIGRVLSCSSCYFCHGVWASLNRAWALYFWARICKHLRSPGIDSKEPIPSGWESISRLFKGFTYSGSVLFTTVCTETSTKLYVQEFGFSSPWLVYIEVHGSTQLYSSTSSTDVYCTKDHWYCKTLERVQSCSFALG
jgi:hypothetical protein